MNIRKLAIENLESKNLLAADLVALEVDVAVVNDGEVQEAEQVPSRGDLDGNGVVDASDIDMLGAAIAAGPSSDLGFDLDGNGTVDRGDMDTLIHDILQTNYGDANLDGAVDGRDFLAMRDSLFSEGSGWSNGDFNTDGAVDLRDFMIWNQNQEFVQSSGDLDREGVADESDGAVDASDPLRWS